MLLRKCAEEGCSEPMLSRGLCSSHYSHHKERGTLPKKQNKGEPCAMKSCEKPAYCKGFCQRHYSRFSRDGTLESSSGKVQICGFEGCSTEIPVTKSYCRPCEGRIFARRYMHNGPQRFYLARKQARKRALEFELTQEEYIGLAESPCVYCGESYRSVGTGLDRVNNDVGYVLQNVMPCCPQCNKLRGDRLSPEETKILVELLQELRNKKRIWE